MKLYLKQRLFLHVAIAFSVFTISVFFFEQSREKRFKTETVELKLNAYADIIHRSISKHQKDQYPVVLSHLSLLLPNNLRVSIIDQDGKVLFDNSIRNWNKLENHLQRPEIIQAKKNKTGSDIRLSHSNNNKYLYYAKDEGSIFVRVALPYDVQVQRFFKSDNIFLYVILSLFVIVLVLLNRITNIFGQSVKELRDFALNPQKSSGIRFPKDEIGEIAGEIAENYRELRESKNRIELEKEKLLQHVHSSKEGICFFSAERKSEFYNALFLQYLHIITDCSDMQPEIILSDISFEKLQIFLENNQSDFKEFEIQRHGKKFLIRIVRFEDKSFEVIVNDITKQEEIKLLKQQMLSNIAHELRTPITGISGYLETILEKELPTETQRHFITQAFDKTKVLTELIQDMTLINKIDEAGHSFKKSPLNLYLLLNNMQEDYAHTFSENQISLILNLPQNTFINGNHNLIYSVFKNLIDNVIRYAGIGSKIFINMYKEDTEYYHFTFYDTGKGISDEKHLSRLFERFYRVEEGRTRDTGGSGLGLSIVKNAINIHGGSIMAKNRKEGGLEFLFNFQKK